jgi:hypothetical protein
MDVPHTGLTRLAVPCTGPDRQGDPDGRSGLGIALPGEARVIRDQLHASRSGEPKDRCWSADPANEDCDKGKQGVERRWGDDFGREASSPGRFLAPGAKDKADRGELSSFIQHSGRAEI